MADTTNTKNGRRGARALLPVSPAELGRLDLKELGATGLVHLSGQIFEEKLKQLASPTVARAVWAEMSNNDAIVRACLYAIDMLCRRATWRVEPGSDDAEGVERAAYLESIPQDMSHSWPDHISEALTMLPYGWSYFETCYKWRRGRSDDPHRDSRYNDGLIGVRKLAIRAQDSLDRWEFDEAGGIRGMWQRPAPDYGLRYVPIEKALLYRTALRKGNPEGVSLLRGAFRTWVYKKRIEEIEAIGIERELNGVPCAWVPPEWLASDASSAAQTLLAEMKKIVRGLKTDEQAGIIMPNVVDENGHKLIDLTLMTTNGRRAIDTSPVIERLSRALAMTMLADVILIGHERVGSQALAVEKDELFAAALTTFLDGIAETLNRHLVPRLWRLNGWTLEKPPKFVPGPIENVDLVALGDYVQKIAASGAGIFPSADGALERELLRVANLPQPPEDYEFVRPAPPPVASEEDETEEAAA